jgi:hypothetical protein
VRILVGARSLRAFHDSQAAIEKWGLPCLSGFSSLGKGLQLFVRVVQVCDAVAEFGGFEVQSGEREVF